MWTSIFYYFLIIMYDFILFYCIYFYIARAVSDDADVFLFDDPLSALDAEVGNKIFTDCIKSHLKNKVGKH